MRLAPSSLGSAQVQADSTKKKSQKSRARSRSGSGGKVGGVFKACGSGGGGGVSGGIPLSGIFVGGEFGAEDIVTAQR